MEAPVKQQCDLVGQHHGFFLVVGGEHGGDTHLGLDTADQHPHFISEVSVEAAEGLIEEEDIWLDYQRPGQGDPLLLSARELVGLRSSKLGSWTRSSMSVTRDLISFRLPFRILRPNPMLSAMFM